MQGKTKPEDGSPHTPGKVRQLRGEQGYLSLLNDAQRDTLVVFHVSWSSPCRAILSHLAKVAQAVEFVDTAGVAAVEVSEAGIPGEPSKLLGVRGVQASELPAVMLLRPGMAPVPYKGKHKASNLLNFLRTEGSVRFEVNPAELNFLRQIRKALAMEKDVRAAFVEQRRLKEEVKQLKRELAAVTGQPVPL